MSGSRAVRKDICCVPIVLSEGSFIALVTVVYILVKKVSLDICREWERREEVHEPLPKDFEWDAIFLVSSLGFVECVEKDGVKLETTEMDSSEGVDEVRYLCVDSMCCWTAIPIKWVYWSWNWPTTVLLTMYQVMKRSEKLGTKVVFSPVCIMVVVGLWWYGMSKLFVDGGL